MILNFVICMMAYICSICLINSENLSASPLKSMGEALMTWYRTL